MHQTLVRDTTADQPV